MLHIATMLLAQVMLCPSGPGPTVTVTVCSPTPSPTPSPAPTATPSSVPTPTASPTASPVTYPFHITGTVVGGTATSFSMSTTFPAGCGFMPVTVPVGVVIAGWAIGAPVDVYGTGTCATGMTAGRMTFGTVVATPTPSPTGTPVAGLSGAACLNIVNGREWPMACRPYSPSSPWNTLVSGPVVNAGYTSKLQAYMNPGGLGVESTPSYEHPIYLASASDPLVQVTCNSFRYGCNAGMPTSIHIPAGARVAGASDHHLAVIQPSGLEADFWGASFNGSTLTAAIGVVDNVVSGPGVPVGFSATSGAALAAGLIRANELASGTIPHALFVVFGCTQGHVYPGTTDGINCSDGQGVPMGSHIWLQMSHAAIAASGAVPSALLPVAYAVADYGAFVEDTGCTSGTESSSTMCLKVEAPEQYESFGGVLPAYPGGTINWRALAGNMKVIQ